MKISFIKRFFARNNQQSAFEKIFPKYPFWNNDEEAFYQMLQTLDESSTSEFSEELVEKLNSISYASNIETYFLYFFPIVSHILYFKPELEGNLIHHLVRPIFAGGTTDDTEIMEMIIRYKDIRLTLNPHFLSKEGIHWVENTLPTLQNSIKRAVEKCWKELE